MKRSRLLAGTWLLLAAIIFSSPVLAEEYLLLRGDLHVHSSYSHDSNVPTAQVIEESILTGYDFIALTEHNTRNHMRQDHSVDGLIVLPGYELTLEKVHINLFGVRSFSERIGMITKKEVTEFLEDFRNLGGLSQINHPNDPRFYSRFGYDLPVDFLEVWNNAHFGEDDYKTLQDWHQMLAEGRKVYVTSGTDAHSNHLGRSPFTNVYVKEKTAEAILDGMRSGHMYITRTPYGPTIQLSFEDCIMGDTVRYTEGGVVTATLALLAPGSTVRVYSQRGLEHELKAVEPSMMIELPMDDRHFYRVEVWDAQGDITAITNPIFIAHN